MLKKISKRRIKLTIKRIFYILIIPTIVSFILLYPFKKLEIKESRNNTIIIEIGKPYMLDLDSNIISKNINPSLIENLFNIDFLYSHYDLIFKDESKISKPKIFRYYVNILFEDYNKTVEYHKKVIFRNLKKDRDYRVKIDPRVDVTLIGPTEVVDAKFTTRIFIRNSTMEFLFKTILFVIAWGLLFLGIRAIIRYIKGKD